MERFTLNEITPQRLIGAVTRRAEDVPHALAWHLSPWAARNRARLEALHDTHRGERCVIMANGPSLRETDFSLIKNEVTFGMNRIYLLFEQMGFTPSYYGASNTIVIDQFPGDICRLPMPAFLNWNSRRWFDPADDDKLFFRVAMKLFDTFSTDITHPITGGATITYVTLQIAYYLGFEEAIVIGLDHSFAEKGTPNTVEVRTQSADQSHFAPNYFEKGIVWQLPDLRRSELAYALAREAYERDGRRIIDATPGGQCTVFEKARLEDVL